jgi:hypothetical protein
MDWQHGHVVGILVLALLQALADLCQHRHELGWCVFCLEVLEQGRNVLLRLTEDGRRSRALRNKQTENKQTSQVDRVSSTSMCLSLH